MGVHMLVCKSLPPDVEGTFCCLFIVCYPSSFCLRQLHRNAECCSALFFAFSSSVYFFLFFLLSAIWMLNWDLSLPVRVTFWAQMCGGGSRAALCQGCPPRMQGHTGRCRWPRRPTALMLPDSCDRIQEELWAGACLGPVLLFLVLLWKIKLSSTLNILLGIGNGKRHLPAACLVVVAEPWVSLCPTAASA